MFRLGPEISSEPMEAGTTVDATNDLIYPNCRNDGSKYSIQYLLGDAGFL